VDGSGKPANLRCLTGSPNGFPEIPARLSILPQVPHRHFDVDKNCGKRIIEKVRDTRRQASRLPFSETVDFGSRVLYFRV